MNKRRSNRIWFVALGMFVAVFLFTFLVQSFKNNNEVDAANMAAFDPGYIISDYQMSNYNSMNEGQIQNFLSSKGRCGNTNFNGVGTRVGYFSDRTPPTTWHVVNGHTVCLAEENMNGESAAHIIWQAAQDYRINPQVLIVLLQKETGLITDPIPNSWDYQRATGYGCPDTAACSSRYYGFKNQVRNAAELFRIVLDNGYSKYPVGGAWVQWSTHAECGSGWVNIKNRATSALYRYTPYQPNAAALASSYGYGDYCSQYGNRNFYSYFEDWFGGIKTEDYFGSKENVKGLHGAYKLETKLDRNMELSVKDNNAVIQKKDDVVSQYWEFKYNGIDDTYTITDTMTGENLDINNALYEDGTNIKLWKGNGNCAQKWKVYSINDYYVIKNACSNKVIDVSGGSSADGTNVQIWTFNDTNAQKWILRKTTQKIVTEDEYVIESALDINKVLDISGGVSGAKSGTNIQLWEKNNTEAQVWRFIYNTDKTYTIMNPATGKMLDLFNASREAGANIQLWEKNESCAQRWNIEQYDDYYVFISSCSEKVIDVDSASTMNGTNIKTWNFSGSNAQRWKLKKANKDRTAIIKDGEYTIASALDINKVLDISGGVSGAKSGTNIQLWEKNNTEAQVWRFIYNTDKTYTIMNPATGKMLDLFNASREAGANIQLWEKNESCAQRWNIEQYDDYYVFISSCSEKVIDVDSASTMNGTNIKTWNFSGSNAQRWKLKKATI